MRAEEAQVESEVALLRRQLERERRARRDAERIGESATAELWRTVQRLEQAEADLRDRAEVLDLSYTLARSLRQDLDPRTMLERAVGALGHALGLDRVVVRVAGRDQVGELLTQWHAPTREPMPPEHTLEETMSQLVSEHARDARALWVDDVADDPRLPGGAGRDTAWFRAYAGVPLTATGGLVVGWLALHDQSGVRRWSDRDRLVAEALAHDLAGALLQAEAHQRQIDTVRQLSAVDEVKNEFVSRVSHELRTPLTSIRGYAELLVDGAVGEPTAAQVRTLGVILRNCQRLLTLTENLLSLSKIDAHQFLPAREPVDLPAMLARVSERAAAMAAGRTLTLELPTVTAPQPRLRGDEAELERTLVNLLGNAVKFTPDGGRVTLRVLEEPGAVLLEVADTGCGIDPEDHPQIFERFYRTRQAQESEVPGAGLGLALVDSIVRGHGGSVDVVSALGEGATFRVRLPLDPA